MIRISVVTPCLNQGAFVERTIRSVLQQKTPAWEHLVMDGGSTDGTIEILKRYPHLKWSSEKDNGISQALNKGLKKASGDVIAWINSDDVYSPDAFNTVTAFFEANPQAMVLVGRSHVIDLYDRILFDQQEPGPSGFVHRGMVRFWANPTLPQPSIFFKRSVLDKVGYADEALRGYMDYDLFLRMSRESPFHRTDDFLSSIRLHPGSGSVKDTASGRLQPALLSISRRYWTAADRRSFRFRRPAIAWKAYYDRFAFAVQAKLGWGRPRLSPALAWRLRGEIARYPLAALAAALKAVLRNGVVLALALTAALLAADRNLFMVPSGEFIDTWVYTGYFLSLKHHLAEFAGTYYGTRLSWILPGAAVHALLPPIPAGYALHLGYYWALISGVFLFWRRFGDRSAAFLAAAFVGCDPHVLSAVSWDYIDGPGITYAVWALACAESAAGGKKRWAWLAAGGAFFMLMVSANLFLAVLAPAISLYYVMRRGLPDVRTLAAESAAAVIGASMMFAVLGGVNVALGGTFGFLGPSLAYSKMMFSTANAWKAPYSEWSRRAYGLAVPLTAILFSVPVILSSRSARRTDRSIAVPALAGLVMTIGVTWTVFELSGSSVLEFYYYYSYIVPFSALLLLSLRPCKGTTQTSTVPWEAILAGLAFAATYHFLPARDLVNRWDSFSAVLLRTQPSGTAFWRMVTGIVVCAASAAVWMRVPGRKAAFSVFLAAWAWVYAVSAPPNWPKVDDALLRRQYSTVAQVHRFLSAESAGKQLRFWYAIETPEENIFRSIASTYLWGYRLVNEKYPSLTADEAAKIVPGTRLVLLLKEPMSAAAVPAALSAYGLRTVPVAEREFIFWGDNKGRALIMDVSRS